MALKADTVYGILKKKINDAESGANAVIVDAELRQVYASAKKDIANAIVYKGGTVEDTDGLGDYAKRIEGIPNGVSPMETLPKQTVLSGAGNSVSVSVELQWQDVSAAGYMVRKKKLEEPETTSDGELVCDTAGLTYVDTDVKGGDVWFYRIFPFNTKRQFQTAKDYSVIKVEVKDRSGQKQIKDLALYDKVKFGKYGTSFLTWEIKDTTTLGDGYVSLACDQSIGNIPFDQPENSSDNPNPITARKNNGNNRYAYSNVRQILNSDKAKGEWFVKQHEYDVDPGYATTMNGLLHEFTEFEKDIIIPVELTTNLDAADGGGSETVIDKIWLPSEYEVAAGFTYEGHIFNGFKDNATRTFSGNWWLRSHSPNSGSAVRFVFSAGALGNCNANNNVAVRPFCALPASAYVRWSDSENAYVLADDSQRNGAE